MFFFDNEIELVKNENNKSNLEEVSIRGLFGKQNVTMKFDKTVNIYIGENGLGKTTILNCIYFILHGEYEKLVNIPFDDIIVKVKHQKEKKTISKADILKYVSDRSTRRHFRETEMEQIIEDILERYPSSVISEEDIQDIVATRLSRIFDISYSLARASVLSYLSMRKEYKNGNKQRILEMQRLVSSSINERVIYLTTYRRIEKDYSEDFNLEKERFNRLDDNSLIRFGMKDVSKAINNILETIRFKTNQGFNKMAGILLSKYAKTSTNSRTNNNYDSELVKIVLDRLGKQIDTEDKESILQLIKHNDINRSEYQYLRDLIDELIRNYNSLKVYDEKIIKFIDTCNNYLNNKKFVYNQSDITLNILSDMDSKIELSMLSSGEKQIVSLFSRLYLENDKKCILLIDEPELSISMKWQKMLLPDIIRSGNCNLLLTVTHSPFIFDNEFDNDAQDIFYCFNI